MHSDTLSTALKTCQHFNNVLLLLSFVVYGTGRCQQIKDGVDLVTFSKVKGLNRDEIGIASEVSTVVVLACSQQTELIFIFGLPRLCTQRHCGRPLQKVKTDLFFLKRERKKKIKERTEKMEKKKEIKKEKKKKVNG